jgi:protein YibB
MNDITIVTAFFDIGRGNWTPDRGLPHYLQRSNDTYLERFAHLAKLDNDMIIFTSEEFSEQIRKIRKGKNTEINVVDFPTPFMEFRKQIQKVQESEEYQSLINPAQVKNPEYWNADYVLVNALKSTFVSRAIQLDQVKTDLIAWLDFGYCRNEETLNGVTHWKYPFSKDKIHVFNLKDYVEGTFISDIIANNDVHITGPCIVADKTMWPALEVLIVHSAKELIKNNSIDDDQTLLLISYLLRPELFELHKVSSEDWFIAFKDFHEDLS